MLSYKETPLVHLALPEAKSAGVTVLIKREELNHPLVSGNKWWKLKYNLTEAIRQGKKGILTFGGAYSNHLYAAAAAARECGLMASGIVRGEELVALNPTLQFARDAGMELRLVSRATYRLRHDEAFLRQLALDHPEYYLIPEGGTNGLALKGVREFAEKVNVDTVTHLCVPVGTGGTLAGLTSFFKDSKHVRGYPVIKGGSGLAAAVESLVGVAHPPGCWSVAHDAHYGGYGRFPDALLDFLNDFEAQFGFALDPVYTGKMMGTLIREINDGYFPEGSVILVVHTGGLQGWSGIKNHQPRVR